MAGNGEGYVWNSTLTVVNLWFRYEEIAMHFNDLIMQFRLQLMAGAGAIGTLASVLIGARVADDARRRWLRFLVSGGLFVLIAAAASLDLFYYNQLLRGALDALLDLEVRYPQIQMSTKIEAAVGHGKFAIYYVYGVMLSGLLLFTAWSWCELASIV